MNNSRDALSQKGFLSLIGNGGQNNAMHSLNSRGEGKDGSQHSVLVDFTYSQKEDLVCGKKIITLVFELPVDHLDRAIM